MLADALSSLDAGDDEGALRALVDAWRAERSPRIAALIDHVSSRVTAARGPIPGKTAAERRHQWLEVEKKHDPCDLGRLLAMPLARTSADTETRIGRLRVWPVDPRIAMTLAVFLDDARATWKSMRRLAVPLLACLEQTADIRTIPMLERNASRGATPATPWLAKLHEQAKTAVEVTDIASLEGLEGHFAIERRAARATQKSEDELLEAIYSAPNDDDVRQVYADFLSEHGDPRGELINLQLTRAQGRGTAAMRRREHVLLTKHASAWLGAIGVGLHVERHTTRFERGFLDSAVLGYARDTNDRFTHSAWRFVRRIGHDYWFIPALESVLATPTLSGLIGVHGLDEQCATWLLAEIRGTRAEAQIEEISIRAWSESLGAYLAEARGLPKLTRLGIQRYNSGAFESLKRLPLFAQLREVMVELSGAWLGSIVESIKGTSLPMLSLVTHPTPYLDHSIHWRFRMERHPTKRSCFTLHADFVENNHQEQRPQSSLLDALQSLNKDVLHALVVTRGSLDHVSLSMQRQIEEVLARFTRLEVVDVPWTRPKIEEPNPAPTPTPTGAAAAQASLSTMTIVSTSDRPLFIDLRMDSDSIFTDAATCSLFWETLTLPKSPFEALDAFCINNGGHHLLGKKKKPVEQIFRALSAAKTTQLLIYRDGGRERCCVELASRSKDLLRLRCDGALAEDFTDRFLTWLTESFLERFSVKDGTAGLAIDDYRRPEPPHLYPLSRADGSAHSLGWITILSAAHDPLFARDDLVETLTTSNPSLGLTVRRTPRNILIVSAPSPGTISTESRANAIRPLLAAIFRRGFERSFGWDPEDHIIEAIAPTASQLGFKRVDTKTFGSLGWRRPGESPPAFFIDLLRFSNPLLHVRKVRDRGAAGESWWRDGPMNCADDPTGNFPAASREAVDKSLAEIVRRLAIGTEPWRTTTP